MRDQPFYIFASSKLPLKTRKVGLSSYSLSSMEDYEGGKHVGRHALPAQSSEHFHWVFILGNQKACYSSCVS